MSQQPSSASSPAIMKRNESDHLLHHILDAFLMLCGRAESIFFFVSAGLFNVVH